MTKQGELGACALQHPHSLQAEVEHAGLRGDKELKPLKTAGTTAQGVQLTWANWPTFDLCMR